MLRADRAKVDWNPDKKHWEVQVLVGAEVIRRPIPKQKADAGEAVLKEVALATARDEGYEVAPENVEIAPRVSA